MRARLVDPELRAFFAAARRDYYDTQISLLMARHAEAADSTDEYARAALQISERSRARMIVDLLQENAIDLGEAFEPELRAEHRELYDRLAESRHQRDLLLDRSAAGANVDAEIGRAVAALSSLENTLNLLEIELRRNNPKYAGLTAPEVLTANQIQQRLDADTVLLQYALGADASYVWAISRDHLVVTVLPDRATIEAAARRAVEGLRSHPATGSAEASDGLAELAALVIAPIAAQLDRRRIVLALDGALQYVPFAVLPRETERGAASALLQTHEIVEIPSMSALALSKDGSDSAARKTLAVFADPVLAANDPRLGEGRASSLAAAAAPMGSIVRPSPDLALTRLLSTSYEAEAIAALVPSDRRLIASGFAASRDAVLKTGLDDYRFIHFATHGLVDARYPGLSALVLSQFDDGGHPQDGFLRLNDIYNLKLNADLVVLSACETALGREVHGEGLIGLTQGFMSAGARSLVASLWQVPDRATAELMAQFYAYMFNDGMRPAEALRNAQLWSASQRRFSHPYFWGGFVLVGDWR
jgi:CHAT domain-containing protein